MKHTKGLLFLTFWLLAMPFAFAQDITDFKWVTPTIQYKKQDTITYCQFTHNQLALKVVIDENDCGEYICGAEMRFTYNGSPTGKWFSAGKAYPEEELFFFYSETAKAWYVIDDIESDDALQYELYYISGNTVTFEGLYYESGDLRGETYYAALRKPGPLFNIARKNNQPVLALTDKSGKKAADLKKYIPDEDEWVYPTKEELVAKGTAFNWQKGFTPTLKYSKEFDLMGDGEPEKFNIDWARKEITYANYDAMLLFEKNNTKDYIRFSGDTLVVSVKDNNASIPGYYTYFFSISKKYNTAILDKFSYLGATKNCSVTDDFFYQVYRESLYTLEDFTLTGYSFCHNCYGRRFTQKGLLDRLAKKDAANSFHNPCVIPPGYAEIQELLDENPLAADNVQIYNDIAFYMTDLITKDTYSRHYLAETCIQLLGSITYRFPDRVVAWLNLADAQWTQNDYKKQAKDNYKKYLALMKAQGKDLNKIPQRVYERIK